MEFLRLEPDGLVLITLQMQGDARGFFCERFKGSEFERAGLPRDFVQINQSRSAAGVLRGIHYQHSRPQGKLVGVVNGSVWDVAVDLRPSSPTFGQSYGCELSDMNGKLLWVPAGFGHGFAVLGDKPADVLYSVTAEYNAAGEGGIMWNDPELAIEWPLTHPELSVRDAQLPQFADYRRNPPEWKLS